MISDFYLLALVCFYSRSIAKCTVCSLLIRQSICVLHILGLNNLDSITHHPVQATDFLLQVFAAAVISWGDHTMPLLLGIRTQWFPWQQGSEPPGLPHALYGDAVLAEQSVSLCLLGLPHSLRQLLAKEPWREQSQKVGPQPPHINYFVCVMTMRFTMWKQITKDTTTHCSKQNKR